MKRIGLVGAGGVGKSSLLKFFETSGCKPLLSVSRQYYALRGIPNEAAYFQLSAAERKDFQVGMLRYYMQTYAEFVNTWFDKHTIADRTVFDHLAYNIYSNPEGFDLQELEDLIAEVGEFADKYYTHIFYIPYPQPWMHHVSIEDGFRMVSPAKNYAVSAIMSEALFGAKLQDVRIFSREASLDSPVVTFGWMIKKLGDL